MYTKYDIDLKLEPSNIFARKAKMTYRYKGEMKRNYIFIHRNLEIEEIHVIKV